MSDHPCYYIVYKGQRSGPYSLRQLQKSRADIPAKATIFEPNGAESIAEKFFATVEPHAPTPISLHEAIHKRPPGTARLLLARIATASTLLCFLVWLIAVALARPGLDDAFRTSPTFWQGLAAVTLVASGLCLFVAIATYVDLLADFARRRPN